MNAVLSKVIFGIGLAGCAVTALALPHAVMGSPSTEPVIEPTEPTAVVEMPPEEEPAEVVAEEVVEQPPAAAVLPLEEDEAESTPVAQLTVTNIHEYIQKYAGVCPSQQPDWELYKGVYGAPYRAALGLLEPFGTLERTVENFWIWGMTGELDNPNRRKTFAFFKEFGHDEVKGRQLAGDWETLTITWEGGTGYEELADQIAEEATWRLRSLAQQYKIRCPNG